MHQLGGSRSMPAARSGERSLDQLSGDDHATASGSLRAALGAENAIYCVDIMLGKEVWSPGTNYAPDRFLCVLTVADSEARAACQGW